MRFEYVVLLIIAFNVVSAVLQRRAKKAREAEAEGNSEELSDAGTAEARAEEAAEPSRTHRRRDRARRAAAAREPGMSGDARGQTSDAPDADPDAEAPMRMPSLGRDILDQLARDLGLKIPAPTPRSEPDEPSSSPDTPARRPAPPAQRPASRPMEHRELPPRTTLPSRPARPEPRPALRPAVARDTSSTTVPVAFGRDFEGHARPHRGIPGAVSVADAAPAAAPATPVNLRADRLDARRLREAFVLKEILDPPVARRPGGRGGLRRD